MIKKEEEMNKSLNMVKSLSLAVLLLSTTIVSAMEQPNAGIRSHLNMITPWANQENVMSLQRRQKCKESIERLYSIVNPNEIDLDVDYELCELYSWIESRDAELFPRSISSDDLNIRHNAGMGTSINYVSDALRTFQHINKDIPHFGYPIFSEQINGRSGCLLKEVLALVWYTIKHYAEITDILDPFTIIRDQESMRRILLTYGLGESVEDHGRLVCDVGISQRVLLCLQGYIEGIQIDGRVKLTSTGAVYTPTPTDFCKAFNLELTQYIEGLSDMHPLSELIMSHQLPSQQAKQEVLGLLERIEQSWQEGVRHLYLEDADERTMALNGISNTLRSYRDMLNSCYIRAQNHNPEAEAEWDINENFERIRYHVADSVPHSALAPITSTSTSQEIRDSYISVHIRPVPSVNNLGSMPITAPVPQSRAVPRQPIVLQRHTAPIPLPQPRAVPPQPVVLQRHTAPVPLPQPRAATPQIAQPRVGEMKTENGWVYRFNGEDWSRLRPAG